MRINANEHGHLQNSDTINFDFQSSVDLEVSHTRALPWQDGLVCRRLQQSQYFTPRTTELLR